MELFRQRPNFDFLGKRRIFFGLSAAIILAGLLAPLVRAPNWGVDFAGGTEIQVQFAGDVDVSAVRQAVEAANLPDANIQRFGEPEDHEYLIRVRRASLFTDAEFAAQVEPAVRAAIPSLREGAAGVEYREREGDQVLLNTEERVTPAVVRDAFESQGYRVMDVVTLPPEGQSYKVIFRGVVDRVEQALQASERLAGMEPSIRRVDQVGAAVGRELQKSALKSMLLAIALILLYVGFRFDFRFAPGGVVALTHDALVVVAFYTISGAEINTTSIAAILTIIGYSINDTIVIFDRVRENLQKYKGRELERVINDSLNETLSRTILTTLTVLLSLIGLVVFTVGTLRDFSLAMVIGLLAGTYSTIFIASPLVIWLEKVMQARRDREKSPARASV